MINKKRLINTFLELVSVDSPSGEEKNMIKAVSQKLQQLDAIATQDSFGNIIAKIAGKGKPFLLNAHLDTVEPGRNIKPVVEDTMIKTDGTTILGGDPKAGVALILEALTVLKEEKKSHVPLDIVFTLGEESGLEGSKHIDLTKITAKEGIVFDGEMGVEHIDTSAPGYNRIDIEIIGRSAHAGVEPEKGLSAIKIAAELLVLFPQGRIDEETTCNIGLISGGSARNAVPELVTIQGEIRSRNIKKLSTMTSLFSKKVIQIQKKYPEAKIAATIQREFDPYSVDPNTNHLIQKITAVLQKATITPKYLASGGGTDANVFRTHGIQTIVMGTGVYEMHTKREFLKIPELLQAAQFCEDFILSLS